MTTRPGSRPDHPAARPDAPAGPGPGGLRRHRGARRLLLVAAVSVAAVAGLAAAGYLLLAAVNPVGDEWQCADGEAPALHEGGGRACFAEGAELPAGYRWDPWGNRPLASNCSRDGWVPVTHPRHGEDCVREGTDLPEGWRRVTEG